MLLGSTFLLPSISTRESAGTASPAISGVTIIVFICNLNPLQWQGEWIREAHQYYQAHLATCDPCLTHPLQPGDEIASAQIHAIQVHVHADVAPIPCAVPSCHFGDAVSLLSGSTACKRTRQ